MKDKSNAISLTLLKNNLKYEDLSCKFIYKIYNHKNTEVLNDYFLNKFRILNDMYFKKLFLEFLLKNSATSLRPNIIAKV